MRPLRVTDAELRMLIAQASGVRRDELLAEMRERVRWELVKRLPSPTGTCASGSAVYVDDRGAYSSGYVCHLKDHSVCRCQPWTWDPPSDLSRWLHAQIERLR